MQTGVKWQVIANLYGHKKPGWMFQHIVITVGKFRTLTLFVIRVTRYRTKCEHIVLSDVRTYFMIHSP